MSFKKLNINTNNHLLRFEDELIIKSRLCEAGEPLKETAFVQNNEYRIISEREVIVFESSLCEINMSHDNGDLYSSFDGLIDTSFNDRGDFYQAEAHISLDISDSHER